MKSFEALEILKADVKHFWVYDCEDRNHLYFRHKYTGQEIRVLREDYKKFEKEVDITK